GDSHEHTENGDGDRHAAGDRTGRIEVSGSTPKDGGHDEVGERSRQEYPPPEVDRLGSDRAVWDEQDVSRIEADVARPTQAETVSGRRQIDGADAKRPDSEPGGDADESATDLVAGYHHDVADEAGPDDGQGTAVIRDREGDDVTENDQGEKRVGSDH